MIALLDAKIVVRFLTCDKSQKYEGLYRFFDSLEHAKTRVELKLIVLFQVIFVLKSFYKVPKADIASGILNLLEYKGITIRDIKIIRRMMEIWRDRTLDIVDCYLIACLEGDTQNLLYSYDHDFDQFNICRKEP